MKAKRHTRLARLDDIRHDPRTGLVVDHYAEDWSALWWVRVDGTAAVHESGRLYERVRSALVVKYAQYAPAPPDAAIIVITPTRWSGWSAG